MRIIHVVQAKNREEIKILWLYTDSRDSLPDTLFRGRRLTQKNTDFRYSSG